ncbi:hypothetical protein [uncultured Clostridium sp.]|uniref:hypothetical protein n=1 Tax=uncultured Clostridium sp. TaxID=59620 RepID=UPI0026305F5B|nr:hypothetical protein [uncultured Clostridium sp.]
MKVISAEVIAKRYTGIDIKVNNGVREFIVNIDKKKLTYEQFKNIDMEVRVYTLVRNCCSGKPLALFETGKSEAELNEIKELIEGIDNLMADKLIEILEK